MSNPSEEIINPFRPIGASSMDVDDIWLMGADDMEDSVLSPDQRGRRRIESPKKGVYKGTSFYFMDCFNCNNLALSPVYFCASGHVFCYGCAAKSETCFNVEGCCEKLRPRKINAYDVLFGSESHRTVSCVRENLGCPKIVAPQDVVNHAQFECSYRVGMECPINACLKIKPNISWGFIDAHMMESHGCRIIKKLNPPASSGLSFKVPYNSIKEDSALTPVLFDKDDIRKFIPVIGKEEDVIYFWIFMVEDGYDHDKTQFRALIVVETVDQRGIFYEEDIGLYSPFKTIVNESKCMSIKVADFEKRCLFYQEDGDPFLNLIIGIFEQEMEKKTEDTVVKCKDMKDCEDLNIFARRLSLQDVIFPNYIMKPEQKNHEEKPQLASVPEAPINEAPENEAADALEKVPADVLANASAEVFKNEENDNIPDEGVDVINWTFYNKLYPIQSVTREDNEEIELVKSCRRDAVLSGEFTTADMLALEENFQWTDKDLSILNRLRNARLSGDMAMEFYRLVPSTRRGIYFSKFLKNKFMIFLTSGNSVG